MAHALLTLSFDVHGLVAGHFGVPGSMGRSLRERHDDSFAKWMAAMTDFDVELTNTARSDWDEAKSN